MEWNPPLASTYKKLFGTHPQLIEASECECELPIIDLKHLRSDKNDAVEKCKKDIVVASSEWGFFQAINHGISNDLLFQLRKLQADLFHEPFEKKKCDSYCWGTPSATTVEQLSWSEAYHIPLHSIAAQPCANVNVVGDSKRRIIEDVSKAMSCVAHEVASILGAEIGDLNGSYVRKNCTANTCYLRLNHYPPCHEPSGAFGLVPHTDSDFLTVLYQLDGVGGLQLKVMKCDDCSGSGSGRWVNVKPNPNALIINVGDLFQAWSNNLYKSVTHRVVASTRSERFSVAYFLCPSYDTAIQGYSQPTTYETFSFGEYKQQIKQDVQLIGHKIGLSRFLR